MEDQELLGRITERSDQELHERRDTILAESNAVGSDRSKVMGVDETETRTGPGPSCAVSSRENPWRGPAGHHTMARRT